MDYQAVWWCLFHCPCSSEWKNCLSLVELLFSLPSSNGKLERTFSQLKIIKTEKRSLLNNQQLDDLLRLNTDVIPLEKFDANPSIDLWWKEKKRRINQHPRKAYKKRKKTADISKPGSSTAVHDDTINVDTDTSGSDTEQASECDYEADNEHSTSENVLDCWDSLMLM